MRRLCLCLCVDAKLLPDIHIDTDAGVAGLSQSVHVGKGGQQQGTVQGSRFTSRREIRHRKSPFPKLDEFVSKLACRGGVVGYIRGWSKREQLVANDSEVEVIVSITYYISNNRFCERIGRQHKSNHILLVADLRHCYVTQSCLDPECRGFRSVPVPIPSTIWKEFPQSQQAICVPYLPRGHQTQHTVNHSNKGRTV